MWGAMAMRQRWSVWVLQGAHAGDNAQARALAHLLGADFTLKQLFFTGQGIVYFQFHFSPSFS